MQMIITDAWMARSKAVHLSGIQVVVAFLLAAVLLLSLSLGLYHWVFLKGAREGWPVVGDFVRLVVKDEFASRDLFMRQNLDVMARQLGEMQAKLTQLESLGDRVSSLAGLPAAGLKTTPGRGGVQVASRSLSYDELHSVMDKLEQITSEREDLFTQMESRLFDRKLQAMMIPTQRPLDGSEVGSRFGWRIDPFSGRSALHTGLDFPADIGSPVLAAAGGMVVTQAFHPEYGNMVEIDHGNDVITRYAHASKVFAKKGELIKRGQRIALVGTSGRSTGPHLHFEVLVRNVWQDPQKFLSAGDRKEYKSVAAIVASPAQKAKPSKPVRR